MKFIMTYVMPLSVVLMCFLFSLELETKFYAYSIFGLGILGCIIVHEFAKRTLIKKAN